MAPVTSTTALAVWPFRVAVTSQVPVFSGRENLVEPTPFRVVSPSVQTTAAPAQVVTLILADWTPRASFSFFSVTLRFCPSAPEKNGTVSVKCGKAAFNLVGLSADDYPDLPTVEAENGVSLPQDLLKKMINECSFAVSTNESRPVYMGTLFEIENNVLTMVSVDGYRLALRREAVEGYGDDCSFIVPGTALSDLERLCGDSDERVVLSVGSKHISFTVGNTVILSRRLEGDFLNYKKAIPESFRVTVKTARTDLLEVVERVSLIIDSKNNAPLRLTFRKDAIDFVCTTPLGKAADSCPCEGDGGDLEIGFNDHYLSDALKAAPAEEINVCLNTGSSPCILVPADGSDNFVYMVLPVRLRAGQ